MTSFTFPQYGLVIEAENIEDANKQMQKIVAERKEKEKDTQDDIQDEKVEKIIDSKKIQNKGRVGTSKK